MIKYIDIGLNLFCDQFAGKEEQIASDALANGVGAVITGSSERSSAAAAAFAESHKGFYSTVGVHPHDARNCSEKTLDVFRDLVRTNKSIVAVGECGLDYDRMYSPADVQRKWFEAQVELAEELDLPLFLHERSAAQDFAAILECHPKKAQRAVVHCFTGDRETALRYLDLGCMIGITGWICDDRRNRELLDAIRVIPAERLMIETDAPYLLPRGYKLKNPNLPQYLPYIAARIAKEKGMDEDILTQTFLENTIRFFGIKNV